MNSHPLTSHLEVFACPACRAGLTFHGTVIQCLSCGAVFPLEPHDKGTKLDRLVTQLEMLLAGGVDGGLFIMIGRKVKDTVVP